jgi:2-polyprenyl-3-methyl-5-hydroxy-6-metoxy-1,4-benzoquinol methylase
VNAGGARREAGGGDERDHYSYSVYADPAMAERFEGMRFSGPIGRLVAETQARQVLDGLAPLSGRTVLDVGTGTGRAAIVLAKAGAVVTGVDASREMLAVAERRARDAGAAVTFAAGDAHHLDFADRAFDSVVCLRVLMHTPDWRGSLAELCRVASRRLVFDYPSLYSAAALQAAVRGVTHRFNPSVEAYRVFAPSAVSRALAASGFHVVRTHRQFVLPIALHKALNSAAFTSGVEGALTRVGVMRLFGSPVTVIAERAVA